MSSRTAVAPERAITSGASRGFTVLLLGGAVQPLVGTALPALGYVWLLLVAVAAFAWSAWIAATPESATIAQVVAAAVAAYLLVLPVVYMAGAVDGLQVGVTTLTACAVAALTFKVRGASR